MKLHYASDLHLEFRENREWLAQHPLQGQGGVLVLAGDIMPFGGLHQLHEEYERLGDQFEHVLWLPGNHEYYGGDINERSGRLDERLTSNVRLLNDEVWYAPGVRILCTTLWTRISPTHEPFVIRGMSDYQQIRDGGLWVHPTRISELHDESREWLTAELAKPYAGHTVVVTHHVPTFQNYPKEFLNSTINQAFAVELQGLIANSGATAWIYGHHHRNIGPYTIGRTRMLTNQLGYVQLGEEVGFDPNRTLVLEMGTDEQ